ncbi:hypothetical protein HAX54_047113, partial [Datura stramonium]|nr:hypothetical protein [Datura stramonium]
VDSAPNTSSYIGSPFDIAAPDIANPSDPVATKSNSKDSDFFVKGSDELTNDSPNSKNSNLLGVDNYSSDVHKMYIKIRADRMSLLRGKRREKIHIDTKEVPCVETGSNLGFNETKT